MSVDPVGILSQTVARDRKKKKGKKITRIGQSYRSVFADKLSSFSGLRFREKLYPHLCVY